MRSTTPAKGWSNHEPDLGRQGGMDTQLGLLLGRLEFLRADEKTSWDGSLAAPRTGTR